jgi:hypothetical protein
MKNYLLQKCLRDVGHRLIIVCIQDVRHFEPTNIALHLKCLAPHGSGYVKSLFLLFTEITQRFQQCKVWIMNEVEKGGNSACGIREHKKDQTSWVVLEKVLCSRNEKRKALDERYSGFGFKRHFFGLFSRFCLLFVLWFTRVQFAVPFEKSGNFLFYRIPK